MSKSSKTLLMLLCICLFAFKVVSSQRFIENGMKRAQIYATYHAPFSGEESQVEIKAFQGKDSSLSFPVPIFLSAILMASCLWMAWGSLRAYLRPIVIELLLFFFCQRIFRPPRFVHVSN